jgi:hypothetical protein
MNMEVVVWGCMDWFDLAQDRQEWGACERGKPSGPTKCKEFLD